MKPDLKILTYDTYAHAGECSNCPQSHGPDGCPMWLEYEEAEVIGGRPTGVERVFAGCAPVVLLKLAKSTNNSAVVAANTAGKGRDATVGLGQALMAVFDPARQLVELPPRDGEPQLTDGG